MGGIGALCEGVWRPLSDALEGGRGGGSGDVERGNGGTGVAVTGDGKIDETGVRVLSRDDEVGMVSRSAAGFDDGVEGRVGGTL